MGARSSGDRGRSALVLGAAGVGRHRARAHGGASGRPAMRDDSPPSNRPRGRRSTRRITMAANPPKRRGTASDEDVTAPGLHLDDDLVLVPDEPALDEVIVVEEVAVVGSPA